MVIKDTLVLYHRKKNWQAAKNGLSKYFFEVVAGETRKAQQGKQGDYNRRKSLPGFKVVPFFSPEKIPAQLSVNTPSSLILLWQAGQCLLRQA